MQIFTIRQPKIYFTLILVVFSTILLAQENKGKEIKAILKNGLGFSTADSSFSLKLRFRVQSRVGYMSTSEKDFTPDEFDFRVRRIRLRLDGNLINPRLTYNIQLAFSRADMDWDVSGVPNVLRDAMIWYAFPKGQHNFSLGMGQGKLPGNRQRVVSSAELQFADRSIVNNALTIDRDYGVYGYYTYDNGKFAMALKGAVTSGEGRNYLHTDKGLAYTARFEILPMGMFTDRGDYFEGDVLREPTPKLSLGAVAHFNNRAIRTGGQLGRELYEGRDLFTAMGDAVFKYKGFALSSEYLFRHVDNPFTYAADSSMRYVYAGQGVNAQVSYCFKKKWEIAARYTYLRPQQEIWNREKERAQYTVGLTKYLNNHRVKLQTDFTYEAQRDLTTNKFAGGNWQWRFQVELGI